MENRIRQQVGEYRLLDPLGRGTFGTVYLAEHLHDHSLAAVKLLRLQLTSREDLKAFLNEARTIRLSHPHIIPLFDFGLSRDDTPYLVMEYAAGGTLRQRYPKRTKLPLETIGIYVTQLASALQYAHDRRVIHRDVKPENILLRTDGTLLLSDFGIAKAVEYSSFMSVQTQVGTPAYMAPEQGWGKPCPASDQYALAIIVYEWLASRLPFQGTPLEVMLQHRIDVPSSLHELCPEVPIRVEQVVLQALAKTPEERFPTIQDFAHALEQASQVEQSSTIGTRFVPTGQGWNATSEFSVAGGQTVSSKFQDKLPLTPTVQNLDEQALVEDERSFMGTGIHSLSPASPDSPLSPQLREFSLRLKQFLIESTSPNSPLLPQLPSARLSFSPGIAQLLEEGENHYKAKQYEEALVVYDLIMQLDPQEVRAQGNKGNVLGRLGRYEEALAAYNDVLAIYPKHVSIWNAKGDMLSKLKRYEEAIIAYTSALALNPKDALTWATKGDMLSKLKRYEEALLAYNQCLDIDSKNLQAWICRGEILSRLRRYEEALVAYDAALALNPNDALRWVTKGKLLSKLEQYEEALIAYSCASKITPKKALIWAAKGEVLSQLKRYEEALLAYERACILSPSDVTIARKRDLLRDLKHHREELARAQVADQLNTKVFTYQDPSAYHNSKEQLPPSFSKKQEAIDLLRQEEPSLKHQRINEPFKQEEEGTMLLERFDVFLSYSHADAQWVENLAKRLEDEHHFRVWLDRWRLIPGQSWQPELARALGQANSCAVCIGEQTPVGWFKQEIQKALDRQTKDPDFRVFAVLLPYAKDISDDFLQSNTWVDFRNEDSTYAFHRLASGVKGEPPGRWAPSEAESVKTTIIVEDMLSDLHRLRQTNLITDAIKEEYMRLAMEKVWFVQWTLKIKDDTNE